MASSWVWLCFSLLAFAGPPPDWGSSPGASDSKPGAGGSGAWRLACSPGGTASFSEGSGAGIGQGTSMDQYRAGGVGNQRWAPPGLSKNSDLVLKGGSDPGWLAAWTARSSRSISQRECSLSLMSTDGQAVQTFTLHRAFPKSLDKSDRGVVTKLVLAVEGVDIVN